VTWHCYVALHVTRARTDGRTNGEPGFCRCKNSSYVTRGRAYRNFAIKEAM